MKANLLMIRTRQRHLVGRAGSSPVDRTKKDPPVSRRVPFLVANLAPVATYKVICPPIPDRTTATFSSPPGVGWQIANAGHFNAGIGDCPIVLYRAATDANAANQNTFVIHDRKATWECDERTV